MATTSEVTDDTLLYVMYNKLFTKILDSSIWLESISTRIVWLTFIAAMDEHGFVQFASVANVAHRARVTPEEAEIAIGILESPDANSSDPDNGGRRVERVPGGWMVINSGKHRDMVTRAIIQEQTRERVRRFRERKATSNAPVTPSVSVSVSDTETKAKKQRSAKSAETWLTPYLKAWEAHYGAGSAATMVGRLARAFKPLDAIHGPARVLQQLGKYLHQTEARFASPQSFAQRFEQWGETVAAPTKQARGHQALAEWLHNEDDLYGNVKSGRGPAGYLATPVPEP